LRASQRETFDEAREPSGAVRPQYEVVLEALASLDLRHACDCVSARLDRWGVRFGDHAGPFVVDPVPRILTAGEWEPLAAGLEQRVRALEAFVRDAYGAREIVAAGVVPSDVIDGSENFEQALVGRLPDGPLIAIAGIDVVRAGDGCFYALEDNLRTPSGVAYIAAARQVVERCMRLPGDPWRVDPVGDLCRALRAVGDHPAVVTDGPSNSAFYEHRVIARELQAPLVTLEELDVRGDGIYLDGERLDVVYRRTDTDTMLDGSGGPTPVSEALAGSWLRGQIQLLNGFGVGVADDKLAHAYVEDMVRFYLGEEPLLPSLPTRDPSEPRVLDEAVSRLDQVVVKPRAESGGNGVVVGPHARHDDLQQACEELRADPGSHVVQDVCWLSEHPTVVDGSLEPRHVDLRAFVVCQGADVKAIPGVLSRFAQQPGALVVNSSQGGGAKDTWVVS
jgi:uncharacterized circularly permuted ATP-grasp superfamily protein